MEVTAGSPAKILRRSWARVTGVLSTPRAWLVSAFVLAIAAIGQTVPTNAGSEDLIYALAMVVPVAFVNRLPRAAAAIAVLSALVDLWSDGRPPPLAAIVGLVVVCGAAAYRLTTPYVILIASPFVVTAIWPPIGEEADTTSFVLLVLVSAAVGFGMLLRSRQHIVAERDASVAAHAQTQRERALIEQRSRIARELHDVVAHHISSIAIQAETARYTTAGLPELGADRFAAIGDSARAALDEMRRLLGVMRDPHSPADLAPQPGLDQVPHLIDETRALGATVHYTVRGQRLPLADDIGVVAYRVIQEALTNARRHAPGTPIEVTFDYTPRGLRITVRDHGDGGSVDAGGFGLIGMGERVAAVGGTLTTGNHPNGGFEVVAELPEAAPEATR